MKRILIFCLTTFIGITLSVAQTTITGKITSQIDGKPIAGALIIAKVAFDITVTSDADGNYSINVPTGIKTIEAKAVGFTSKTENIGENKVINFTMTAVNTNSRKAVIKTQPIRMGGHKTVNMKTNK